MKKNELTQIKGLDMKELREKAKAIRKEIANLVMDKNMKKLKDVKLVYKKRKDLAKALTILRQKDLLAKLEPKTEVTKQ